MGANPGCRLVCLNTTPSEKGDPCVETTQIKARLKKPQPRRKSRATFLPHSFQGSFFSGNHQKPRETAVFFVKRTRIEKNGTWNPSARERPFPRPPTSLHDTSGQPTSLRREIPKLVRCTLEALIVIFVHNKEQREPRH